MQKEIDPFDIIEARVKSLELKVFGESDTNNYDTSSDVVEMLSKSQTLMTSAISSQEKVNKMVKRLDELELVLDPLYEDTLLDYETKVEMILLMENQLYETLSQLKTLKELSSVLESDQIRNIPKIESRLNMLTKLILDNKENIERATNNVNNLLKRYNDIIVSFTKTFAQLNDIVTNLEIQAQPKKVIE